MAMQVEELGAVYGETQRFECQVVGFPTPTITWYKDETEISDNIRYQIDYNEEQGTIALIIRNVTLADEGLYQCKAENSEGYATTTAYLVVKVDLGAGSAMDYSSMTIEKVSEEEHSQVEVLKTGYQTIIEEVITRVEESEREEIEEKSFAPKITYDKVFAQDLHLKIGATIAFEVTVRGYPRPAVTWFHDDTKLEGSSRISVDFKDGFSFLKVQSVTGEDAGMYKVQAENAIGLDAATFKVVVKAPPSLPQNLRVIEVSKDYVILSWEPPKYDGGEKISGYEIEKSLDGMVFVSAGFVESTVLRHKLIRLKEGAEYVFRVSAENKIGLGDPATLEKPVVCKLPFDPPTQPKDLNVIEFNKDFVTLGWTEPQSDGGSQIIQYVIEKCDTTRGSRSWTVAGTVGPKELTFRASKLFQGNVYLFRVLAENQAGPGPAVELAAPVMAKLPYDKPLSPQRLQVTEVDSSSVTLSWEAPESDGGSTISGYLIERRDVKRSDYIFVASVEASTLSIKIPRLVEGNEYYFRVFAENQVGSSASCETEKPIKVRSPHETPGCPRAVRVKTYWSDSISIAWDAPEFDGGSAITGYVIEQRDCSGDTWTKAGTADVSICQFKAESLISGNQYLFRVFAVNQLGLGVEAGQLEQPCTAKMPFDPPFAPILLEVSDVSTNHVTLSWRAPEHDGGSPITGYVIEQRDDLVGIWTLASKAEADVTSATIAGLPEGQTYFFRVAAVNECGRGSFTETRKPVTTLLPCSKPSKPLNLKALSVWKDYVIIGWDEPSDDGGSLVTGFTIEQRDAQDTGFVFVATVDGSALQHQVTNLLEGHEYYFRVFSQNSVGLSEQPAELRLPVKTCAQCEIPSPPVNVRVTETGDGLISIAWDAPKITEITPVSRYLVETCLSVSTNWRGAGIVDGSTTTTFNLTGLVEGDYYFVRVFSENESGRSKRAAEICEPIRAKKPSKVPCSPSNLRVTELSKNSVTIMWDMLKFDGVSDPTQYVIDMRINVEGEYADVGRVDGRLNCFTMELFDKGKQYYFRVRSKNSAGYCETAAELDSPVEFKGSTVKPFPPENLTFSETTDNSLNLSWNSVQVTKRYIIEQRDGLDGPFFIVSRCDGSTSSVFIDNLLPNQAYTFRIWAENECGRSESYSEITRKLLLREGKQEQPHDTESFSAAELKLQEPLLDKQLADKSATLTALKELTAEQDAFQIEQTESRHMQRVVEKKILQDESLQPAPLQLTKIKLAEQMQITRPIKPMLTELETEKTVVHAELKDLEGIPLKPELGEEKVMAPPTEMTISPLDQDIEAIPEPSISTDHSELEITQSLLVKETELEVKQVSLVQNESMPVEKVKQTETYTSEAEEQQVRAPMPLKEVKQAEFTRAAEVEQDLLVNLKAVDRETEPSKLLVKQEELINVKELELVDLGQEEEMKLQKPASVELIDQIESVKLRDADHVESSELKKVESADARVSDLIESGTTDVNQTEQGELKLVKRKSVKELESAELRQIKLTDDVETRQTSFKHFEQREKIEPDLITEKHSEAAAAQLVESADTKCVENVDGRLEDTKHQLEVVELDQKKLVESETALSEAQVESILETSDHPSSELIIREKEQESDLIKGTEPTEEAEEVSDKLPSKFGKLCIFDVNSDSITLKWEAPLEIGGTDVKSYIIVMRESSKTKYKKVGQIRASTLTYQVSNLKEGHEYWFRVFAENSFGISKEFAELETPVKIGKRKKEKIKVKPEEKIQLEIEQDKEKFSEEYNKDFTDKTIDVSYKETSIEKVTTEIEASKEISELKTDGTPLVYSVPTSVEVKEGEAINIPCQVKGIPQPELKFYKDDEMLKLRKKDKKLRLSYDVTDDLYILEISNPTAADAGNYRIEATNKLGSAEAAVTVTVVHDVEAKVDEKSVNEKVSDLLSGEIPQLQTVKELRNTSIEELTEMKNRQSKELIVRDVKEIVTETQIIKENSESKLKSEMEAKSENVEIQSEAECKKFEAEIGTAIVQVKPDGELKSVAEYNAETIQTMIENELKSFTEAATETVQAKIENELRSRSVSETNTEGRLKSEAETKIKAKLEYITEDGTETVEAKREAKEKSKDVEIELNCPSEADVETLEVIGKTALKPENEVPVKAELVQTKHERGRKEVTEITTEAKDETETIETKLESSSNLLNETSIKTVEMKTETHVSSEAQAKTKTQGNFESEVKKETTTTEIEAGCKLNIKHDTEADLKSGSEIVAKSDVKDFSTAKTEARHVTESNAEIATESKVEVKSEAKKSETIHGEYLVEEISGNLPVFTLKPEPVTVLVGEAIQLSWKLTTDFKMEIEWLKNGKKLKAKKDKRIRLGVDEKTGNNFLMITEANLKDVGQYELRVDNEFGRIVQMVFVNVISKPSGMPPMFEEYPKPQVVTEGESFEIACKVAGDPSPQIQFFKNGELISVDKDNRLTFWSLDKTFKLQVKDALPEDSGEYAVTAVNAKGKTSHSITVDVKKLTSRFGEDENTPLFLTKLVPLQVKVGEDIKLNVAVKELSGISVSWFKDGCPLISDKNITIGREENVYFLEVHGSAVEDSGEYTCTANSGSGACFCSANVVVSAGALAEIPTETEGLQAEKLEALERSLPTESVQLLGRYYLHDDWNCKEKNFRLSKGDIVEVLDMENKDEWLVRLEKDRKKVCFVPIKLLTAVTQDQEERGRHSSDEEAEDAAIKAYPLFMAVTKYVSSEEKALSLEEDEVVEVLNSKAADNWLCRKLDRPQVQGWVPASILIAKSEATKLDTRSTQEVFREDVIKISNKQQEATMKRRYALKDLWESERDYVRDLRFNLESYHDPFKRNTPNIFQDKMDILFSSLPELVSFHNRFLENLADCTNDPDSLADCFLNAEESFQLYVSYLKMLPVATKILEIEDVIKFLKDYDMSIGNVGEHKLSLPQYLQRPSDRLTDYSAALKDFMRYTARANQSCGRLEQAVVMIDSLRKKANDQLLVDRIVNYDGNLTELGPVLNHETFAVWKGESTGKTKEYHVFLFRKKLLLTRQKKSDKSTYDCKAVINLSDALLNDLKDKKFELCFEDLAHGKYTFEAKLAPVAESWHQLLATLLPKWGKKPEFMTVLEDVSCKDGAMVQLTCKAYGQPIPSVAWYFNGNAVSLSTDYRITSELCQHTLSIPSVSLSLGGEYSIKVWNPYGEDNTKMTLTVKEDLVEPKFTSELHDCNILLGADAKFSCKISGKPLSIVKWFKDEVELKETDRLKILPVDSQTQILILTQVDEVDLGTYECRAVNKAGSTSSKAKLNITNLEESKRKQAPAFLYGFGDMMAIQDKELCLTVTFSGYPAPQVTWQFQGQNLKTRDEIVQTFSDNSASLKIKSIKPEHAGQYTCCLSNQHGTTEVSSVVSVASSPFIASNLSDTECLCGKEVSFRCQFKSLPVPDVSWTVNGQEVAESERIAVETTDSGTTLTIKNVVPDDAGDYACHLANVAGEASSSAKLTCHLQETSDFAQREIQKPVFETSIENQRASIGSKAEFSCKFVADECISIKWFKDGSELTPKDNIEMSVKDNCPCLMIKSVEAADAGSYQCTVANSHGKVSCTALLNVELLELDLDEVAEKKLKELKLMNIPPIMPLDKPSLKEIDQNLLEISWLPATLPPAARQTPISYILERKDLNDVTGDWIQIQTDIIANVLNLNEFSPTKDCLYRIRAANQFGISDPSMSVTYYGKSAFEVKTGKVTSHEYLPPKAPKDKPTVTELKDDALRISWQPSELPSGAAETDIWYVVERRCPPSRNWIEVASEVKDTEYVMHDYRPEKDYMFRIRAGNDYGLSDPTMSATLFTKPIETPKPVKKKDSNDYKSKVKPRTIWDKPEIIDVIGGALTLRWKPSSLPQYALQTKIWYIVEQRIPPDTDWTKLVSDLTDTELRVKYAVNKDYYFRIRAANEFGIAEPSMPVMMRKKEDAFTTEDENQRKRQKDKTGEDFFSSRRVPDHLRVIPEFIGNTDDTQYGVEGQTSEIVLKLKGYPEPKVIWNFHNTRIEMGDKYTSTLSRTGELVLQIHDFSWSEVGEYKAIIENEFGAAVRTVKIDIADPPTFLEPMKDQVFHLHQNGRLECRVQGIPYPTVKFKKDWRQVAGSHRVKVAREDFDHWSLNVQNAIRTDEGVYECVAENVAGKVYCTANVKITEKSGLRRDVKFNAVPVEDYFHVIDELGRGSYGIIRRLIDKNSGNQYAAKFLRFSDPLVREELAQELEMMSLLYHNNIVQVIDGYEDKNRLVVVMEIVTGGELLQRLVTEDSLTESEVAFYLRQLLVAVEYMHSQNVIHLDLKPENLLLSSQSSDELKVIDFGFARRYNPNRKLRVKYASPEFCSPEVARDESVTPVADLWSVGVIAYILLTGVSPFYSESARQTLLKVQGGKAEYPTDIFSELSESAKEFVSKLLEKDPRRRMSATEAIEHPFLQLANHRGLGNRIGLERHKAYVFRRKWERGAAIVRTVVQPKPLSSFLLEVPAVEVDVPGTTDDSDRASLAGSVQLEAGAPAMLQMMGPMSMISTAPSVTGSGDSSSEWGREYEDEDTWYEFSTTSYQTGPETHLFPSKDTGLSLRMAKYRRTTHSTSTSRGSSMKLMKERRDLRDLDKELDSEDPMPSRLRSLWHRKSIMTSSSEGCPPIFKEKIRDKAYNVGDPCTLKVHVIGNPQPVISWYRNDELLTEGGRVRVSTGEDGRHSLTILQTKPNDFGVYKCVARNKHGTVTCRARMLCGDHPSRPGRPHVTKVSDREAFLIWEEPDSDGNSYIQSYKIDFYRPGDERWTSATYCIDECALIKRLRPDTTYRFRVSAINKFGPSPYSWASVEVRTKKKGTASLDIDAETKRILLRSRQATSRPSPEPSPAVSPFGSTEDVFEAAAQEKAAECELSGREVLLQETDPSTHVQFGSEVWRGRFSVVLNVKPKEGHKIKRVAKISEYDPADAARSLQEYEMLKAGRQEHVVRLHEAFLWNGFVVLVFEKLFGENVVRSMSLKNRYNEYTVTSIIKQVLDAVQFLHHHGIVHLNIQPDNVIMQSRRRFDVKLIDFGQAHKIATPEGVKVSRIGTAEFMAPEKVTSENVGVAADVWGIGVLTFILLSGISPFYAETEEETFSNIEHVRYDAHALYHNITKFGLKFLLQTLKRKPKSRLTVEECLDNRWLMLNQVMVKSRRQAVFSTEKLKLFLDDYISRRMRNTIPPKRLLEAYGSPSDVVWSASDEEDEPFYASTIAKRPL